MDPISILKWRVYEYFSTTSTPKVANTRNLRDSRSLLTPSSPEYWKSDPKNSRVGGDAVSRASGYGLKVSEEEQLFRCSVQVPRYNNVIF